MTDATAMLVVAWFALVIAGMGATFFPVIKGERRRGDSTGVALCLLGLAPQAPLMLFLGRALIFSSRVRELSPVAHIPGLLGIALGTVAFVEGLRRMRRAGSRWESVFAIACLGVAMAVGSFTALVFAVTA